MKWHVTIESAAGARESMVEFPSNLALRGPSGRWKFARDGEPGEVDWAEVAPGVYSILLDGRSFEVTLRQAESASRGDRAYEVLAGPTAFVIRVRDIRSRFRPTEAARPNGPHQILAPMPGRIVKVLVTRGQKVGAGDSLLVMEAMKMQNELRAPHPGRVEEIYVREGEGVESHAKLALLV